MFYAKDRSGGPGEDLEMMRICILNVLVSGALCAMGGSCQNLSGPGTYHFKYIADTREILARWGKLGTLLDRNVSGWGSHVTPQGSLLTADWFGCKVQEWTLDGRWKRTIGNSLRSDGYSIKCRNSTGSAEPFYQRVDLSEGHYRVEFLAFTNGGDVSASDVVPFAAQPEENGSPGTNEIESGDREYAGYVLTFVDFTPPGNRSACFITGDFTVGSGESGVWDIGAEVQGNKLVYVASATCFKTGEL